MNLRSHQCRYSDARCSFPSDRLSVCPNNISSVQLTYLPKKYHQYIVPGVRRVYLEVAEPDLRRELAKAKTRIQKLERDQEKLLAQCEQHMSAARAHAQGEHQSRTKANNLKAELQDLIATSDAQIEELTEDRNFRVLKYEKLKARYHDLAAE